ncbi:glutathione S-transferase [Xylaria arbuscula]|nr:glutathione S-transferase [Xylaria arbuscula]
MAPFGKIYTYPNNPRVHRALILADLNGLEIETPSITIKEFKDDFAVKFPLGKVPAFEGADGFYLTESVAIATYLGQSGPKASQILGADAETQALITQWTIYAEAGLHTNLFKPLAMTILKYNPFYEYTFNVHVEALERDAKYLETVLQGGKKHLVGDQLTLADVMVTSVLYHAFKYFFDAETRKGLPNLTAYIEAFASVPEHKKYYGKLELCETRLTKDNWQKFL